MAAHSSVLAWRIPGMGEPGGLEQQQHGFAIQGFYYIELPSFYTFGFSSIYLPRCLWCEGS